MERMAARRFVRRTPGKEVGAVSVQTLTVPVSADLAAEQLEQLLPGDRRPETGAIPAAGVVPEARNRDALFRRALAIADIAAAATALMLGVVLLGNDELTPQLVAAIPLVVVVGKIIGLYDRDEHLLRKTTLEEVPALFQVSTLYTLLIWLGSAALVEEDTVLAPDELGRMQVVGIWGLLFLSMIVARTIARSFTRRATGPERCLVLGGPAAAEHLERKFEASRGLDATLVGRVPLEHGDGNGRGPAVLGGLDTIDGILVEHEIHRVVIAPTTADAEQLLGAIRLVKALGVKVSVLPRLFEVVGSSVYFDDIDGLMLLGVPQFGLSKSSLMLKRTVDIAGVGLRARAARARCFAICALAIKLTSHGPVLFRQPRIGREGVEFNMLKFRTMYDGADERKTELLDLNEVEGLFKIADDPRVTPVGRVLRRLSIDELPQLINVLRGEMSLVGPRPLVTDDDRLVEGLHRRRLDVPPGMTGIWQVLGHARVPLHEMVKIDYLYGANWSLWLDLKILLRTVPHVIGRRGL